MKSKRSNRYSPEVRARAVRMVQDHAGEHLSKSAAVTSIASKIGCTAETLNRWVAQEVFCGGARPPTETMMAFIHGHRDDFGVEQICRLLPIAPSTFYAHVAVANDPERASNRARRDAALRPDVQRVWEENYEVYGVRKIWRQMQREGFDIARCTVARLMKQLDIQGVIRGKQPKTTIPDPARPCPLDKVNRQFRALAPNTLWVSDFTYVSSRCPAAHACMRERGARVCLCRLYNRYLRRQDCRMAGIKKPENGLRS